MVKGREEWEWGPVIERVGSGGGPNGMRWQGRIG